MGRNIKDFNSWQRVNEGDLWSDWVNGLTQAITGKETAQLRHLNLLNLLSQKKLKLQINQRQLHKK